MTSSSAGDSGLVELSSSLVAAGNGATLDVDLEALPPGLGLPFLRTFGVSAASDPAFLAALRVKGIIYISKGGWRRCIRVALLLQQINRVHGTQLERCPFVCCRETTAAASLKGRGCKGYVENATEKIQIILWCCSSF